LIEEFGTARRESYPSTLTGLRSAGAGAALQSIPKTQARILIRDRA
jgi:hypothetical protein